jgi:hypothetical protein
MRFWLARRIYDVDFFICRCALRIQGTTMEEFQEYWKSQVICYNVNLVSNDKGEK